MYKYFPFTKNESSNRIGFGTICPFAVRVDELTLISGNFDLKVQELRLPQGSRTALVGPNGSGKTTLVETLLGLRSAQKIQASILGSPIAEWRNRSSLWRRVGVQLQQGMYPSQLMSTELITLHEAMFKYANSAIADALGISRLSRVAYRDLSGGQRQRLNLYMALAHEPELLILDEPFTGLDRNYAQALAQILTARQHTLLYICHAPEELALADHIVCLRAGRVKFSDNVASAMVRLCGRMYVTLCLPNSEAAESTARAIAGIPSVSRVDWSGPCQLSIYGDVELRDAIQSVASLWELEEFSFRPSNLDDLLRLCTEGCDA